MKTAIVTAPQGAGKTIFAPELLYELGMTECVDPWHVGQPLKHGALHLTCATEEQAFESVHKLLAGDLISMARIKVRGFVALVAEH